MVDSLNARKGLYENLSTIKNSSEFKKKKNELKKVFHNNNSGNIMSEYYEYFDETDVKKISSRQNYYLYIASQIALKSEMKQKHGAVLVYKKDIISTGYNYMYSTYSIHAEVAAIASLKGKDKEILSECELYVVRIGPKKLSNILKYSKPCIACQNYIKKNFVKKTFYSTNYNYDEIKKIYDDTYVEDELHNYI